MRGNVTQPNRWRKSARVSSMSVKRLPRGMLLLLLVLTMMGCSDANRASLGVSNGTALVVTLTVNGQTVGTVAPGDPSHSVDLRTLPALPWTVEARSPSGRLLTSMTVEPGDVRTASGPDRSGSSQGAFGRVDLSCGRLTIWAGATEPSGPAPVGAPGIAGDCAP